MTRPVAAAAALLAVLSASPSAAQPLSPREFGAWVDALAATVREADAAAAGRLAAGIPAAEHVVAAGDTYDISFEWLQRALAAAPAAGADWPERRRQIGDRLDAIAIEVKMLDDDTLRRDAAPREALASVLTDRRFQRAKRMSWQAVLQERIRKWVLDFLGRLGGRGWSRRQLVQGLAWTVSSAAVIVLLVWLARVSLRRRADRPTSVGLAGTVAQPGHVLAIEAAELIGSGRIREGARAAYRAALRRLEEEGVLRPDAASTPRETLRLVAPSHRRAAPLAALTSAFERMWYGSRPASADDGPRLLGLLRELECLPSDRAK
jgi:hypothetical protein